MDFQEMAAQDKPFYDLGWVLINCWLYDGGESYYSKYKN